MTENEKKNLLIGALVIDIGRLRPSRETVLKALAELQDQVDRNFGMIVEVGSGLAPKMRRHAAE